LTSILPERRAVSNLFEQECPVRCDNTRVNPWILSAPAVLATGAGLTAYGARYPHSQLFGAAISRTDAPRKLAITFDDGPNPSMTPKLLDLLARHDLRVTFFLIGRYAQECPELVQEIRARGHVVGNHTQGHPNLIRVGPTRTRDELRRCQDAITTATDAAAPPKWFRPPWGFRSPWLAKALRELDLRTVMWSLLPGDWRAPSDQWLIDRTAPIASRVQQAGDEASSGGDILCLHDGSHRDQNADRSHTLAALEYWLPRWRDLGLEFVTIEGAVCAPAP
jgi:peptidoglycan/xylan/chitin deacetylase (PgdA/CDA1 family)